MLRTEAAPQSKELANAPSANDHRDFVSTAVSEMLAANAVTLLPPGERPTVVSPLGVVPKRGTDKFRLTVNMRYVNRHLGRKVFKFEGLKDLSDLAEKGDYAVSYDLMSGYYHVGLHLRSRTFVGFKWEEEGWHQVAPVPRRCHVYEVRFLAMRPDCPAGGEGLRPRGAADQCAQVPFDPGTTASAA